MSEKVTGHPVGSCGGTYLGGSQCGCVRKSSTAVEPADISLTGGFLDTEVDVYNLAACSDTPADVLVRLAEHENPMVRLNVAANPNAPARALELLCEDSNWMVAEAVANHPNVTLGALIHLSQHEDPSVLTAVLCHPKTPKLEVDRISDVLPAHVKRNVLKSGRVTPILVEKYSQDEDPEVREMVASLPTNMLPVDVRDRLITDSDWTVRRGLMYQPDVSTDVLVSLEGDEHKYVRRAVAAHGNATPMMLSSLSWDECVEVREMVAQNPITPTDVLTRLMTHDKDLSIRRLAFEELTRRGYRLRSHD